MADMADNAGASNSSRRSFLSLPVKVLAGASFLALAGCEEDKRTVEEKTQAAPPEYATRYVMHCPKCGSPTAPHSINNTKSFYKCTGNPPKHAYHAEKTWSRRLDVGAKASEK
jgi:hypothetical protein